MVGCVDKHERGFGRHLGEEMSLGGPIELWTEESRDCWTDCRRQGGSCEGPFRTSGLEGDDDGEDDHVLLRTVLPALPSDPVPSRASTLLPMIPFMSCRVYHQFAAAA